MAKAIRQEIYKFLTCVCGGSGFMLNYMLLLGWVCAPKAMKNGEQFQGNCIVFSLMEMKIVVPFLVITIISVNDGTDC